MPLRTRDYLPPSRKRASRYSTSRNQLYQTDSSSHSVSLLWVSWQLHFFSLFLCYLIILFFLFHLTSLCFYHIISLHIFLHLLSYLSPSPLISFSIFSHIKFHTTPPSSCICSSLAPQPLWWQLSVTKWVRTSSPKQQRCLPFLGPGAVSRRSSIDRKSTRLNSSHRR